jgi:hypothetical protein
MNLSHAKAQRRKGTKNKKGIFGISYSDSATPNFCMGEFITGILR